MGAFHFVTNWMFEAPIEPVWDIITDVSRLPEWWPDFKRAEVRGTDRTLRVGQVVDCKLVAPMRYALTFALEITALDPPAMMRLQSTGDLVGWGQWDLRPADGRTAVTYTWHVAVTRPVLATLGRLAPVRALLSKNHELVMSQGYERLRRLLAGALRTGRTAPGPSGDA